MKSPHPLLFFVPQRWTLASCPGAKTRPERWLRLKSSTVKPRALSVKTSLCTLVGLALSVLSYSQTILFQETFDDAGFGSRGWYDNVNTISTTAEQIPGSGRLQGRIRRAGFLTHTLRPAFGGSRTFGNWNEAVFVLLQHTIV
jgi:hypothetical protein